MSYVELEICKTEDTMFLSQRNYINKLLKQSGMNLQNQLKFLYLRES